MILSSPKVPSVKIPLLLWFSMLLFCNRLIISVIIQYGASNGKLPTFFACIIIVLQVIAVYLKQGNFCKKQKKV